MTTATLKINLPSPLYNVDLQSIKYRADRQMEEERKRLALDRGRAMWALKINPPYNVSGIPAFAKRLREVLRTWDAKAQERGWDKQRHEIKTSDAELRQQVEEALAWAEAWEPTALALKAAKSTAIKGRKPAENPRKTDPRTLDHTGTCACCGRNVKIPDGKLYDHGFHITGGPRNQKTGRSWGVRQGSCFGVGFPPDEISPECAKALLKVITAQRKATEKRLADLKAMDPKTVVGKCPFTQRDRTARDEIYSVESELRMLNSDEQRYNEHVKNWKRRPLPDGRTDP